MTVLLLGFSDALVFIVVLKKAAHHFAGNLV